MAATSNSLSPITLVLASSSPRRRELIATLGLPVHIKPSDADESTPPDWTPALVVEQLSLRKAQAVAAALEPAEGKRRIVIGSDTIVALAGEIMGKPKDAEDAKRMLRLLSGRTHEVYTGVTCMEAGSGGRTATSHRVTRVQFRSLTEAQIDRYVATGEPMDKAGAYGIQDKGALLVEAIEGCFFTVVGLPLSLLAQMLEPFGVELP
ncbi:Maf family protein [Cohnella lubricantis]|uniref:dTTP/UTP pyrophosphatase n=1 Tax=Cohnella lubricantis TaxID=2163172 RepID=A0A841TC62_9BACL|nr:Maf family protein [Cohnella lubricantis]MBB6677609.1 septum formation inhibitor Maf [Cohnella lubricantis]MBP2116504.1 septum formation protein [Cohnella lubricantis]